MTLKRHVHTWHQVATYLTTYDLLDGRSLRTVEAYDVQVSIGEFFGEWYIRTADAEGGRDEAPDIAYATEAAARDAIAQLVDTLDERAAYEAHLAAREK